MTNREKWAKILPIIQAFVDGKPIQCKIMEGGGLQQIASTVLCLTTTNID
jgi:hypothetical protein